MATINSGFSNVILNGSDFVAKTIKVLKWDYIRATMDVFFYQSYKNLGEIQRNIYIFISYEATKEDKRNIYILRDTMQYIFFYLLRSD